MEVNLSSIIRSVSQWVGGCFFALSAFAQKAPVSTTIPFTLDHNRIIIEVDVLSPDGKSYRVKAWVDNGDPVLSITTRLAGKIRLKTAPGSQAIRIGSQAIRIGSQAVRNASRVVRDASRAVRDGSQAVRIGGMNIGMAGIKETELVPDSNSIASGMNVEMNIPSTLLRDYAVVVDYPNRKFTIARENHFSFQGRPVPATVNPQNGLIQIASVIDGGSYNLALDLGTPVSFISNALLEKWQLAHASWPHMRGAIGLANLWGIADEPQWELLRIPAMIYGGIGLTGVVAVGFPKDRLDYFQKRAGLPTIGLMGAASLMNYRIGIDYFHSTVYFQEVRRAVPSAFNVVGLILRPEADGSYSVLGVADYKGRPSVPGVEAGDRLLKVKDDLRAGPGVSVRGLTMGRLWSLLSGSPGESRVLELSRKEKLVTVSVSVRSFL